MINNRLYNWQIEISQAKEIQIELSGQVSKNNECTNPRFIAGIDISSSRYNNLGTASVVVLSYPELSVVEIQTAEDELKFPYIPGFLSFREIPLILNAFQKLSIEPDLLIADGQGIAHPRRLGLASHVGLLLDIPSIGCAKSRLCGQHEPLTTDAGHFTNLTDNEEIIGAVVRTRDHVKPVYVSIGHRVDLISAIHWVLKCCRGYRLPEPCRLAHIMAGKKSSNLKI